MTENDRHYFVYGNTAQGFINKLTSNLQGTDKLYIIRGRPGAGKACLMKVVAALCDKSGFPAEYLHCPTDPETYDGIIVPELNLAVIDGTDLHYTRLITSDPTARYIDTDTVFNGDQLRQMDENNAELIQYIGTCHEAAFQRFADALHVHDEWEKIYIENMDFSKADALTGDTIKMILGAHRANKMPITKERFFGASTPKGALDYIENLTGTISKRYLLKGRPGTGKSTLLRKLTAASAERGLDTEVYSCAFDSGSLDMIIWPELDVCLFDSTAPHLYEPSRPNDEIIDMYTSCVKPGTDEKYERELDDIMKRYKTAVQAGTERLAEAKIYLNALTDIYTVLADPNETAQLCAKFAEQLHK